MNQTQKKILVIEDEEQINEVVKAYLQQEGYRVISAYTGKEALALYDENEVDFIVLDLMLPDITGEELCKGIRLKSQVPILMLTAKSEETDRINGLDIGADDYMIKPFSPKELVARVRAIFRRLNKDTIKASVFEYNDGDLKIDTGRMKVWKQDKTASLTPTEFNLLTLLAQNPGKVFSREELIERILGYDYDGYDRTIDTHIKNVRHKLEDDSNKYIRTVYGIGYKFEGTKVG